MRSLILGEITLEEATAVTGLILRLLGVQAPQIEIIVTQAVTAAGTTT